MDGWMKAEKRRGGKRERGEEKRKRREECEGIKKKLRQGFEKRCPNYTKCH